MSFDLFQLVPSIYKLRDAQIAQSMQLLTGAERTELVNLQQSATPLDADEQARVDYLEAKASRGPLQSLLTVIDEQLAAFAEDLDQLYDDQFIETCAPWVISYIGDLIGYRSIHGISPSVNNPRSEVANTISLRRRKGTPLVLEQLARDITGWGAHVVEFFRVLGDTQYSKHIRCGKFYTPNLRRWEPRYYMNSGFDRTCHKVDVHRVGNGLGSYNIRNIGIFVWSLGAYSVTDVAATPVAGVPNGYRFSSLGMDMPLFHQAISQGEQISSEATPANVPGRLSRLVLCDDLRKNAGSQYYGQGASLWLILNGQLLNSYQVQVGNLSGADGSWANLPVGGAYSAIIDPELGRIAVSASAAGASPTLTVSYNYGFNANMGGGEYAREDGFEITDPAWIFPFPDTASAKRYADDDLPGAVAFVLTQLSAGGAAALEITTSNSIAVAAKLAVDLPAGAMLELRAADNTRPTLLLSDVIAASGSGTSTFIMNGLLVAAGASFSPAARALLHVPANLADGSPNSLTVSLLHCTFVPGWSVTTAGAPTMPNSPAICIEAQAATVNGSLSIVGAVRAVELATVTFSDSIIDATDPTLPAYTALKGVGGGGSLTLTGCTVVGKVHAQTLTLVSNSIIWAALATGDTIPSALIADRKQEGCVRFSFIPVNSATPRRFECVERSLAGPQPIFFSLRYGRPGYLKMLAGTDKSIRNGADDGGEMGAFHFVLAPLREADLNVRLQEYLPVGLDAGLVYQS